MALAFAAPLIIQAPGCGTRGGEEGSPNAPTRAAERESMVERDIMRAGVHDELVLQAMRKVPRELFVPEEHSELAYADHPLPIGHEVTISQPAIVGLMSQLADLEPGERVLEIGTGSGYQAAVLDAMGVEVYSMEIIEPLAKEAEARLERLGYDRVTVRHGDGYQGWPEKAPFHAIILTAAPPEIPAPLLEQLAIGGFLVAPVGTRYQELVVVTRTAEGYQQRSVIPVRFVPMTGQAQQ